MTKGTAPPAGAPAIAPRAQGHEGSGEIVEVGEGVQDFKVGDRITYNPFAPKTLQGCGKCVYCLTGRPLGCTARPPMTDGGCMAEYQSIDNRALYKLPDNVSFDVGALIEPFGVGYHGVLETVRTQPADTIAILGPGTIGLAALIAAKLATPKRIMITGTNSDEAVRFKVAKELGADDVINVQKEDAIAKVKELSDGLGADIVVEAVGGLHPQLIPGIKMLRYEGTLVLIGHPSSETGGGMQFTDVVAPIDGGTYNEVILRRKKILGSWIYDPITYVKILSLLERKLINLEPLITHRLPLTEATKGFEAGLKQEGIKVILNP